MREADDPQPVSCSESQEVGRKVRAKNRTRYQPEGAPFIEKYLSLLAAGGSKRPAEIVRALDIDIADAAFWQGGMDLIRRMVDEAKSLAAQL